MDLDISVTPDDGDPIQAEAQLIRGHDHQFRLEIESEKIGRFMLGQGACPWLCGRGTVFLGTIAEGDERRDPICDVEPNNIVTVRAALGLVTVLQLAPEMLEKWVKVTQPSAQELRIDRNDRPDDHIVLVYDGTTPREATFSVEGVQGSIRFRAWAFDAPAHPSMFAPAADSDTFEVPARDVYRMMGALFNFAVEAAR